MGSLADRLARLIAASGPISVAQYMAEANAYYYATRDPLGTGGDFTTAPEISQMFGELVGAWLADLWLRAGKPGSTHFVELGPGRGTLAADALRVMATAGLSPAIHFVETSPILREAQVTRVPAARWHDGLDSLPDDGPLLVVANEFFDALPVRQLVAADGGWRELMVTFARGEFRRLPGPPRPAPLDQASAGTIVETSPATAAIVGEVARRIHAQGGAALIVDYGHGFTAAGDTLQAVARHRHADPWSEPGERDLTAFVDFETLGAAAAREGVRLFGPRPQGEWLAAMGLDLRAQALAREAPERAEEIEMARERLAGSEQMGEVFKAMALTAESWPQPAGFA